MAPPTRRVSKLGRYSLPTKAINGLLEDGVDGSNIDDYSVEELQETEGFGAVAAKMLREQRGQAKAAKRRGARTREKTRTSVQKARNVRLTEETYGNTVEPRQADYRETHDSWLDLPGGNGRPEHVEKSTRIFGGRLIVDIGEEHGLFPRHTQWMERIVQNVPAEMLIDSIERLLVVLIRKAMANDPTKGGQVAVQTVKGQGGDQQAFDDFGPTISVD